MKLILDRDNTRNKIVLRIDTKLYSKIKEIAREKNESATLLINQVLLDYVEKQK